MSKFFEAVESQPIRIWNRAENREEVEQVYGESAVNLLYGTKPGQLLSDWVLSRRLVSRLYGMYQSSKFSQHKIDAFIRDFRIPMEEYEDVRFHSFNDFFIRKFKPGARSFLQDPGKMPAFAEARYLAWDKITPKQTFPVKGECLSPVMLLGGREASSSFAGGPLLLARLCPTDYHRFHFPDDGTVLRHYRLKGRLHSVNPRALEYKGEILSTNERHVTILQTKNFGKIAYIEVGALCVGRIVQSHSLMSPYHRGDEKGYFLFGGSTVIIIGEPGAWTPDQDLLDQTAQGRESLVRLGEQVAHI